jgi:acyl-CoA reductase-like NAD-dependent aldehyde dehydrogenase
VGKCVPRLRIFISPKAGINSPTGNISFDQVAEKLVGQINSLVDNPKAGPYVLGAIQNKKTSERIAEVEKLGDKVWLKSRTFENPMFKNARVATPIVLEVDASKKEIFSKELFGPIILLIKTKSTDQSIST